MQATKAELRRHFKSERASRAKDKTSQDELCRQLLKLPQVQQARRIHCYYSVGSEAGTHAFLKATIANNEQELFMPVCVHDSLVVRPCLSLDALQADSFGIPSPVDSKDLPVEEWDFDIVVCPGLAFDLKGTRLGYGKGHYDRFFSQCKGSPIKIGLCYDVQIIETLPSEVHDVGMDVLVSDKRIVQV